MLIASEKEITKMKKRSMILALASMLGISAAATAVSGFAWFTTTTTADIASHNYKVAAAQGSLQIAAGSTKVNCGCTVAESSNTAVIAPTTGKYLTDVSSINGEDFFKAYNINTQENSFEVKSEGKLSDTHENDVWMSQVNETLMVAVSWTLNVTNTTPAGGPSMDIYLSGDGTHANPFVAADNNYADAYRLAVFVGTSKTPAYFFSTTNTGFSSTNETDLDGASTVASYDSNLQKIVSTADAKEEQKLATIIAAGSVILKFVVWCEGTIVEDGPIANVNNQVALSLGLVGLSA